MKILKSAITFILLSLFIIPSIVSAQVVSLTITGTTVPTSIEPGDKGNLILSIANTGTLPARDLKLTLRSHSFIVPDQTTYSLQTLNAGNSVQAVIPITVLSSAQEGSTAIFFTLDYKEGDSTGTRTIENSISISITKRALIGIRNVTYNKGIISRGDTVMMTILFENLGRGKFKDLTVSLKDTNLPFVPADTDTENFVGNVDSGQQRSVSFNIIINKDADNKAYSIPVTFSFFDESSASRTETKTIGLRISGKPEFVVTVDRTENLYAGSIGKLTISIANRGTATAQFLTTYFNDVNIPYNPTESYVGNLDPDDTSTVTFDLNLAGKSSGKYELPFVLSYKDSYNQEFTETRNINIQVAQMPIQISMTVQIVILAAVLFIAYMKRHSILGLKDKFGKKKEKTR